MDNALSNTGLTYINPDAFRYLTNVTGFHGTFYNCTYLTSIPANLFYYNTAVTDFSYVFYNCSSLSSIPSNLFQYNNAVTSFRGIFELCSSLRCSYIDGGSTSTVVDHSIWPKWGPSRGAYMLYAKSGCKP